MKQVTNLFKVVLFGALLVGFTACNKEDDDDIITPPTGVPKPLRGSITTNTTWRAGNKYILSGFVYVDNGATLTIEPGTIIKGDKPTKGSLIVQPGAKIIAVGTQDKPIVFTSNQAKGQRAAGDWGGLVLLGKAPVNKTPAVVEGENVSQFGGTDPADNSGPVEVRSY